MVPSANRWVVLALALVAGPRIARAEMPLDGRAVPTVTLTEALRYAAVHHPEVRSALAELAARHADGRVPRAQWLPQIGATAQLFLATANNTTDSFINVPELDLPRIGGSTAVTHTDWAPHASSLASIGLAQEVYDFGHIAAQIAVADARTEEAHASAASIALDIQLGVEEAYHSVLAAKAVLAATEEAARRAATHRDYALAGKQSGMRPPIDLTRAQAIVAQLEVQRIRAVSGLEQTRAALAASMGSTEPELDAAAITNEEGAGVAPAFDEAVRAALQHNPLIAAALARVHAQKATTSAVTHELLPNVSASAGLSGRAGGATSPGAEAPYGSGWLPDVANWHVGLVLEWNLFDGTVLARRSASQARENAAAAQLDLAKMSVALGAERAYLELDAALKVLPGLNEAVDAARANQAQADARFTAGLGNIIELADAESLLINAQLDQAIGQFAVARARAALGRVMGQTSGQTLAAAQP